MVSYRNRWYVVGHDRDRDAPRLFRLSRVSGPVELTGPDGLPAHEDEGFRSVVKSCKPAARIRPSREAAAEMLGLAECAGLAVLRAASDTGDPDVCDGDASYIVMNDDSIYNLYVPSGENTGLKLVNGYTVPVNDQVSLTAEFDLGKSITAPPGQSPDVKLRPTIKLVDNNEVGTLTGQVANALVEAEACQPSVYVFNDGVMPNGIEDDVVDPDDPIATALVEAQDQDDGTVQWHYTIGFLLAGEYEAAFTCPGDHFEPANGKPVTIVTGELATVDFEAPAT